MKLFALLILIFVAALDGVAQAKEKEGLPEVVERYAATIKGVIDDKKWTVEVKPASIVIESKFKVQIQRIVSPSLGEEPDMRLYRIELKFQPYLSKEDFIKLAKERVDHAARVNYGTQTKREHNEASKFLEDNPLPRYDGHDRLGKKYSIYRHTLESPSIVILPLDKFSIAKGLEAKIDVLFWPRAQ